ncbi:5-(carboxyamino)imidazole ribonucleotide synthase [Shewanella colwelliana]|uniref:5-(carboxyamino)imidazole ribonucleotide synthase n=1 Tax=Shewanella colwelliana TaxID=23 RepID=UPI003735D89F
MRIGIIGCGQLARMMALAGLPLGIKFSFVADSGVDTDLSCVEGLGIIAPWQPGQSIEDLYQALGKPDVITVEKEQVDLHLVQQLETYCTVRPSAASIAQCKSRIKEKQLLAKLDIPCAPFTYQVDLAQSAATLGLPMVIKSLDEGYDGKNQWVVHDNDSLNTLAASENFGDHLIEQWIPFDKEVSLIGTRGHDGDIHFYPLTENVHRKGILIRSTAPAKHISPKMEAAAQDYMRRLLEAEDYVGVLAMELFVVGDQLLVNELAPRVHNSGHWTQMGATTCQFENHIRAVAGLPLGATTLTSKTGMLNLLGVAVPPMKALSSSSSLHWYNKESKPNRKLGHINFTAADYVSLDQQMDLAETHLY